MPRKYDKQTKMYIYHLTCKTSNITDSYISYTTNLVQRKYKHKRDSLDVSCRSKLYECIRMNGGWENWDCLILEESIYKNDRDTKELTSMYILKFKPSLNDNNNKTEEITDFEPNIFGDKVNETKNTGVYNVEVLQEEKYQCICNKTYTHRSSYYKHTTSCLTFQHAQFSKKKDDIELHNIILDDSIIPDTLPEANDELEDDDKPIIYRFKPRRMASCEPNNLIQQETNVYKYHDEISCEIQEKSDDGYTEHESDNMVETYNKNSDNDEVSRLLKEQNDKLKEYIKKMISALTVGSKKRNKKSIVNALVFELLDQNKTLQNRIIELSKERNIVVNTTNNNQFNLNFFLNEQCKNAVNFTDFVNSLEITMDDLDYTRNQGLVEGISKVMIDGLKQLDLYKRPIHCTDQKRDTIYVRDNHRWTRDEGNAKIRKAFVDIANKEYVAVKKWMDLHPGWETNHRLQDFHHNMMRNVLHEIKDDPVGERKIMKSVEREVFIEK
jgi:hypothetical protein